MGEGGGGRREKLCWEGGGILSSLETSSELQIVYIVGGN